MKFSKSTTSQLKFYVYGLIDPRDKSIFYIGKGGSNNRAFSHLLEERKEPAKNKRIAEIRASGDKPVVDILRHGIESDAEALEIEATLIDAFGKEHLTNEIRGHGTARGRRSSQELERLLGSPAVSVETLVDRYMAFFIHKSYTPTMSEIQIYDCTRQFWHNVSEHNRTVVYDDGKLRFPTALALVDSVVVRAYNIVAWHPAGSTLSTRTASDVQNRWEFVGQMLPNHELLNKRLVREETDLAATQVGYTYLQKNDGTHPSMMQT